MTAFARFVWTVLIYALLTVGVGVFAHTTYDLVLFGWGLV